MFPLVHPPAPRPIPPLPTLPPRGLKDAKASDPADPTGLQTLLDFLARNPHPVVLELGNRPANRAA